MPRDARCPALAILNGPLSADELKGARYQGGTDLACDFTQPIHKDPLRDNRVKDIRDKTTFIFLIQIDDRTHHFINTLEGTLDVL